MPTDRNYLHSMRTPTREAPLQVLVSACLTGIMCGVDGTANGEYPGVLKLITYETVRLTRFCPEDYSFGTPREMCDIYGGTGADVAEGRAKVLTPSGADWTQGMINAAKRMVQIAQQEQIELAVMMDISAACGSQVIYDGNRYEELKVYQIGAGVCAAMLTKEGFRVISQRDYASLEILYQKLDPNHTIDSSAIDHHETEWYKDYFGL